MVLAVLTIDGWATVAGTVVAVALFALGIAGSRSRQRADALEAIRSALREFYTPVRVARFSSKADPDKWRPFVDRLEDALRTYRKTLRQQEASDLEILVREAHLSLATLEAAAKRAQKHLETEPPPDVSNVPVDIFYSLAGFHYDPRTFEFRATVKEKVGAPIYPRLLRTIVTFGDSVWLADEEIQIATGRPLFQTREAQREFDLRQPALEANQ